MPIGMTADIIGEKNAQTNQPIWLYRIETDGVNDIYLAEYDANVEFFKDTDTAQSYTAFPITHDAIEASRDGSIPQLTVTIGNVNRAIQAYIEDNDGLRGNKVTIRLVFADQLGTAANYLEHVYYIDSCAADAKVATFTLSTKMDIMEVMCPRRKYMRGHCQFVYKGRGCWVLGSDGVTYEAPVGFEATNSLIGDACGKTVQDCEAHVNIPRFGSFPGVPVRKTFFA